jgi:hypothetical protein
MSGSGGSGSAVVGAPAAAFNTVGTAAAAVIAFRKSRRLKLSIFIQFLLLR